MVTSCRKRWPAILACSLIMALCTNATGQYFGQNKVQYENFQFEILKTEHFDIYFYPEEKESVKEAANMAERWYYRHSRLLQHELRGRQPFILYASHPHFEQTNAVSGGVGEGTGGVTEALKRRIVLPFGGPLGDTDHVIGHELVHAFQYDITGRGGGGVQGIGALYMPLWFIEGMAEYLSLGPVDALTAMWIRDAVKHKKLPNMRQLEDPRFFPYRYGEAFLAYIGGRWGDEKIGELLKAAGESKDIYKIIRTVTGVGADTLVKDWHQAVQDEYEPLLQSKQEPLQYGKQLISRKSGGGDLNIAPALSPDGSQIIFFSEKDLFAINLFLADAETGKIKRIIVKAERDPHLESLQFINSAGAWDNSGQRIAFASVSDGRPALNILDVPGHKIIKEIPFNELGEILNPSWSPDGRLIAFSAIAAGFTDLFIYDLETGELKRITDDPFSDIQPSWSPDGKQLAFVTDRFSSDLQTLNIGNLQLALYDRQSGSIIKINGFAQGKHINPQWSSDGKSLYFLSDHDGISNVYRIELQSGNLYQLTDLYSGVSGITAISPALATAQQANRLVFCAYEEGKYNIYEIDDPVVLAGQPVSISPDENLTGTPAMLPPLNRPESTILTSLNQTSEGLLPEAPGKVEKYRARLSLDTVFQPYVSAGVDRFGAQFGGGTTLLWSDMLGNRNLVTALQLQSNGRFTDLGAILGYYNIRRRLNWGAAAQQIPLTFNSFFNFYALDEDSSVVFVQQELQQRQINREISGSLFYPFSRVTRIELVAGFQNITFNNKSTAQIFDAFTGEFLREQKEDLPAPNALNLESASAAYVYDNSFMGATGPLFGQRYRLAATPTFGSLNFYTILVDYRRYFLPARPFTIAFRALHYGRYGKNPEDDRLQPLFIGYQSLVRGYDSGSFSADEFDPTKEDPWQVYNQLFGSRMLIANLEMRFPLLGLLGLGGGYYGILPLDLGFFYDAGVAWTRAEEPTFLGGDRHIVKSFGLVGRLNLFGFAILELDFVKPVDRPKKGWLWQFNFTPGF